jgi:hypothetical protein
MFFFKFRSKKTSDEDIKKIVERMKKVNELELENLELPDIFAVKVHHIRNGSSVKKSSLQK